MTDVIKVANEADMIVNGYAFTHCTEGYRVLNLNRPKWVCFYTLYRGVSRIKSESSG